MCMVLGWGRRKEGEKIVERERERERGGGGGRKEGKRRVSYNLSAAASVVDDPVIKKDG